MINTHGGKRIGSGRKKKDATTTLTIRIPVSKKTKIKNHISKLLKIKS